MSNTGATIRLVSPRSQAMALFSREPERRRIRLDKPRGNA
jgi:hypothetical protein